MGAGIAAQNEAQKTTRSVPTVGMRGGLGRTLLTAFLFLTILPLALIGAHATQQNKRNIESEAVAKIQAIATLTGESFFRTMDELEISIISTLMTVPGDEVNSFTKWFTAVKESKPGLQGIAVQGSTSNTIWTEGYCATGFTEKLHKPLYESSRLQLAFHESLPQIIISVFYSDQTFLLCVNHHFVEYVLNSEIDIGATGQIALIVDSQVWPSGEVVTFATDKLNNEKAFTGQYEDASGMQFVSAYYPLPWEGVAIQVKQSEIEVLDSADHITATLIALILSVLLGTTFIAAVVVRQITRPVIHLTESALAMAGGDLDQHLEVRSRDEIGILTYVFNEMAAELKSLYEDLEAKVAERTKRLQRANYQIQRRAIHLQASQEVSQAITSVRDPGQLLTKVVDVIRDRFVYSAVAIYIIPPAGSSAILRAVSPRVEDLLESKSSTSRVWPEIYHHGDGTVVDKAMETGEIQIDRTGKPDQVGWYQRIPCRVAIPLKMEKKLVGIIGVDTSALDGVQDDELDVLELLGNQVTIALENARVYERERLALEQLEEAEIFKSRFLGNMSHELREPLNTVIGFSRLLMKGVEGPLNDQQIQDVEQIYNDSQHLMFLINDILAISQIQAGLLELTLQPVQLCDIVDGIMPTAGALVRGKDIEIIQQLPENIPLIYADPNRLRQILIHLLNNAAKYTRRGWIKIRAWQHDTHVYISVIDTGIGIPISDRERIFTQFEQGGYKQGKEKGAGLGLALCKEFVEMHGGHIWVDSEVNAGSTFTFSIPICKEEFIQSTS